MPDELPQAAAMTLTSEQKKVAARERRTRRAAQLKARERRVAEELEIRLATERQEWTALLEEIAEALRDLPEYAALIPLVEGDIARIRDYPPGLLPWRPDRMIVAELLHRLMQEGASAPDR